MALSSVVTARILIATTRDDRKAMRCTLGACPGPIFEILHAWRKIYVTNITVNGIVVDSSGIPGGDDPPSSTKNVRASDAVRSPSSIVDRSPNRTVIHNSDCYGMAASLRKSTKRDFQMEISISRVDVSLFNRKL